MKVLLTALLIFPLMAFAQIPYQPITSAGEAYFSSKTFNNTAGELLKLPAVPEWQSIVLTVVAEPHTQPANTDFFVYSLNKIGRVSETGDICDSSSWLGEELKVNNQTAFFKNRFGEEIRLEISASSGEQWVAYSGSEGYFSAEVTGIQLREVLGVEDSVKIISLQFRTPEGIPANHPFNGKKIEIAKKLGFVRTYDFYFFPADTSSKVLVGKSEPSLGIQNLKAADIFNFQEGDVFHYQGSLNWNIGPNDHNWYTKRRILDKAVSENGDTLIYSVLLEELTTNTMTGPQYVTDTIVEKIYIGSDAVYNQYSYSLPHYLVWKLQNDTSTKGLPEGYTLNESGCLTEIIFGGYIPSSFYYQKGLGKVLVDGGTRYEKLVYYKKSTGEWGQPLDFPTITSLDQATKLKISIHPNPTPDAITVNFPGDFTVSLLNFSGKVLLREEGMDQSRIDIGEFPAGVYFLKIEGDTQWIEKIIKQ